MDDEPTAEQRAAYVDEFWRQCRQRMIENAGMPVLLLYEAGKRLRILSVDLHPDLVPDVLAAVEYWADRPDYWSQIGEE